MIFREPQTMATRSISSFSHLARPSPLPYNSPLRISRFFSTAHILHGPQSTPSRIARAQKWLPHSIHQSSRTPGRNPLFARFKSSQPSPNPTPHLGSPAATPSLSQRLKQLSKEYGWSALGVYLALSVLDFPFCFLAVRLLGTDRIGKWEHAVTSTFWSIVAIPFPSLAQKPSDDPEPTVKDIEKEAETELGTGDKVGLDGEEATIWTQLALAYIVHKSLIFFRVPLTAAVLPKVVKVLRSRGWNVGRRKLVT